MGFVDASRARAFAAMTAKDYVRLALLGAAGRRSLPADDVAAVVHALCGPNWSPTAQMVLDGVDDLVAEGLLNAYARTETLEISAEGRQALHRLLAAPIAAPMSPFGRIGLRLKLAFLDLAPAHQRRRQVENAIRACECEIAARASRCPGWELNGPYGQAFLDHQVDGLEDLAGLLRRMARAEMD
jgi:DNA-binding PadR family transcriptional regulator